MKRAGMRNIFFFFTWPNNVLFSLLSSAFDSHGSLHTHLAEVMETKDTWNRHRRKRQIIRTRKAKGYNGFDINCSCVCSSCYALFL